MSIIKPLLTYSLLHHSPCLNLINTGNFNQSIMRYAINVIMFVILMDPCAIKGSLH